MEMVVFVLVGAAVGMLGAMLGIGGGMVIVPALVFLWHYEPQLAIGTSMLVVLLNAISGTLGYWREGKVCLDAAWKFALATVPGAFLGSYASEYLQGRMFFLVFGTFFVLAAIQMYLKAGKKQAQQQDTQVPANYNWQLGVVCSIFVGFLASILGIGGGIVHVPMMVYVLGFPAHVAVATSTCILAVSSVAGVVSHGFLGHISWLSGLLIGAGAFAGAQIGVRLAGRLKSQFIMQMVAVLVFCVGTRFIASAF